VKRLVVVAIAALAVGLPVLATSAQTPGNVTVLAVCNTEPETTAIINTTDQPVAIFSLSSIKDPQPYEPIPVNQELAPGASVTFYLGPTAPAPALSTARIYDNTAPDEGAVVETNLGLLTALCGSGSTSLTGLGPSVAPAPTAVPAQPTATQGVLISPPSTGDGGLR
jgi:hypothetical protein